MSRQQRPVHEVNKGRFERRIRKTDVGCWIWTATVTKAGHPIMPWMDFGTREETTYPARRYAWEEFVGPIEQTDDLSSKKLVVNTCNNELCVCPAHSELRTARENFLEHVRTSGNKGNKKHVKTEQELLAEEPNDTM